MAWAVAGVDMNSIKILEDALNEFKEIEKTRNKTLKEERLETIRVCSNYKESSKLIGDDKKQRFIDSYKFDDMDHLNEWIKRCDRDFVEMIERLNDDML